MSRKQQRKTLQLCWKEEDIVPQSSASDLSSENGSYPSNTDKENVTRNTSEQLAQLTHIVHTLVEGTIASRAPRQGNVELGVNSIPWFNPNNKALPITKWINKVEELKSTYGWNETTTIYYATNKFDGYAKIWYESLSSAKFSWTEWKEKLVEAFPEEADYAQLFDMMLKRKRQQGESLVQYYYEKLALLNICEVHGRKATSFIIAGIPDINIQIIAKGKDCENPEELLKFLKTIENSYYDDLRVREKKVDKRFKERYNKDDNKRYRYGESSKNMDKERRKCYRCGSRDHLLPNCPKNKCRECNRNHYGPCDKKNRFAVKDVMALEGNRQQREKFFFLASINGEDVEVFLDLGSEINTLKLSILNKLKLSYNKSIINVRGFGGGLVKSLGIVQNVEVKIDQAKAVVDFVVVPDEVQLISAIIGQPFTEKENVVIYKNSKELRIFENSFTDLPCVVDLPLRKIPIWAKNSVVLPPKHMCNILCKTDSKGLLYLETSLRMEENNEYCLLRCVIKPDVNNECVLPVVNPTDREIIIKNKNVLARAEKCSSEIEVETLNNTEYDWLNNLNINESLTSSEKEKLYTLITEYKHCFTSSLKDLGCTNAAELRIDLLDDKPVTYRPYRMNPSSRQKVREIVDELLDNGIVQESFSPYASPVLLVKKKSGEQRLCIDYRKLNDKIRRDAFPLPRIDDQLDQLQGYNYFTTLDMTSGYYQIPVEQNSKAKTAFITPDGHYEFNRMPFGICTAPSIFQRMMNKILAPLRGTQAIVYLDDVLIPSKNIDDGLIRLRNVLNILTENRLTLKPQKCFFFQSSITYLGFEINGEGIKPGNDKTKCIEKFPTPRNVHQVRQFLGLTGFFRQFIKNYASITRPLTNLLKKEQKWNWSQEQNEAFENLKKYLSEKPVLAIYNPSADTEVHTDASKFGLAGMLLQKGEDTKLHVVAYYSRQTTPTEQVYHSYELETLAVVETLKKFRVYLLDIKFVVVTDCNAIKAASTKRDLLPRIARWWLTLQEFTFEVQHRPGVRMAHVDALSRANVSSELSDEMEVLRIEVADWVLASQLNDEKIKLISEILQRKPNTEYEENVHRDYKFEDGRIYRVTGKGLKWLVPRGMRNEVVRASHDEFGHFALEKTLRKLCENYWFPNMRNYVQRYIQSCIRCLYHKQPAGKQQGFLNPIEKVAIPFDTVHIDHLGPFVKTTTGKKYLIVCVEAFTKYVQLQAVKDTKTQPVLRFLESVIDQFGTPRRIVTDKGTCYTSKAFEKYCREKGIIHVQNAVSTPRANGQVERFNSTILSSFATTAEEEDKWDRKIKKVQFAINNSVHSITQKTPSELLFGFKPRAPADAPLTSLIDKYTMTHQDITNEREKVVERIRREQEKQKRRFDRKRIKAKRYQVGELVLVRKKSSSEGQSKKLLPKYKGPFQILKQLPRDRYVLRELSGSKRSRRAPYENVESVEHLKKWIPSGGKSDSEVDESDAEVEDRADEDVCLSG